MIDRCHHASSAPGAVALLLVGLGLGGCANMSDTLTSAFADPAKYDNYDCKQLQAVRKALAARGAELQGLIAKAETGTGGAVISEVAYRNDYLSTRASANLAEEVWRRNSCVATPEKAGVDPLAPRSRDAPADAALAPRNVFDTR
jgi:hypothetical protein